MDEVQAKRETVVITKHGKPVAKLVPADKNTDDIYNFLVGKGAIAGDTVSQQLRTKNGENSSDSPRHACCRLAGV
jgi:antitoxin (DNA-binding transcriptional repressor) of toxin-antitoxin stability system